MRNLVTWSSFLFYSISGTAQSGGEIHCNLSEKNLRPVYVKVHENITKLKALGKLNFPAQQFSQTAAPTPIRFAWPMRATVHGKYPYYQIGNFTDLDTSVVLVNGVYESTGTVKDFMGNSRSYDTHQGIDIGVGPFHWKDYEDNAVTAIAAADGIIVEKHDGEIDNNCNWDNWAGSTGRGNHLVILHNDGSTVSFYMHLKNGSLTSRNVGETIKTGDYIGIVASSGRSTGPHLHFQVNIGWAHPDTAKGKFVEPFAGPQNWTTDESLWINQLPYNQPEIMSMESYSADISGNVDYYTSSCDRMIDFSRLTNGVSAENWRLGFRTFFRDWITGGSRNIYVMDPLGNVKKLWQTTNSNNYRLFYNYDTLLLGMNPTVGTWSHNVAFNGKTYSHYFTVGCVNDYNFSSTHSNNQGFIAGNNITSTATISSNSSNNIEYKADNAIILQPGFIATAGCTFLASPDGCERGKHKFIR